MAEKTVPATTTKTAVPTEEKTGAAAPGVTLTTSAKDASQTPVEKSLSPTATETDAERLRAQSEISIWIDTWDDIFSDFDPRPLSQRALSVDFLDEAKRASREKRDGQLVLHILAPTAIRSAQNESVVRKRLKEHFTKHAQQQRDAQRAIARKGYWFVLVGTVILLAATCAAFFGPDTFWNEFLVILLEPAGWFTVWNGFDFIVLQPRSVQGDVDFYARMAAAEIKIDAY